MQEENYQGAVDNFKKSLLNNPDDEETRYNYVLAKELLKNQNNNKDKKDNKDNKDNKDKEKNKDQNQSSNVVSVDTEAAYFWLCEYTMAIFRDDDVSNVAER